MRQGYTPHEQQILDLTRQVGELRLALETATRELDEIRATGGTSLTRLDAAERERDEALRIAADHRCVEVNPANCPTCSALSKATPPADAATEAVREAAERLSEALCHAHNMPNDNAIRIAARHLLSALSTPAPAPSAPAMLKCGQPGVKP